LSPGSVGTDEEGTMTDEASSDTTGGDESSSDTADGCIAQPEQCHRMIECLDTAYPGLDLSEFEVDGACWCGGMEEAEDCLEVCLSQLDTVVTQYPTISECHGRYCPLEELNIDEPYGPSPCGAELTELLGLPVPGGYCAPDCDEVTQTCPGHSQTTAQGTCMFTGNPNNLCALRCYVDPYLFTLGNQCHCGAICRPYGGVDGDGHARGICTYD
jgi:hypothetical protein